ncbi:MAG: aldolase [Planctomycetota bacterium]|nr:MAG: aldolase [Planctomycetota bacterium]
MPLDGGRVLEAELREQLVAAGALLERRGLIVATDGNLSARLPDGRLLVTPAGSRKGALRPEELVLCDPDGAPLGAGARPSSEVRMHARLYAVRPEAGAVVHAHPPAVVALSLAGRQIAAAALPEVAEGIGEVALAPYAHPGTETLARRVAEAARQAEAVVLERHGALTLGRTVEEALLRMERLAWAGEVTLLACAAAGGAAPPALPAEALVQLRFWRTQPRRW